MPLPTFLIIGANKASTTSLFNYLKQHPDIFMSRIKEPMFFVYDGKETPDDSPTRVAKKADIINNVEDYKRLFAEAVNEKERGEASTAYLPCSFLIADRIKSYVPDIKLICILRNPIERAYSGYRFHVGLGIEKRSFKTVMKLQMNPSTNDRKPQAYFHLGLYAEHVEKYYQTFGKSRMKVYLFEDWCGSPQSVLRDIYEFLEVDPDFINDLSRKLNISTKNDLGHITWHRISQTPLMRLLPERYHPRIKDFVINRYNRSQLTPEIRKQLIRYYYDDVKKLEKIIERDLSHWLE